MRYRSYQAIVFLCIAFNVSTVLAVDHKVLMRNASSEGFMSFDPSLIYVAVGDTVTFIPKDGGHNVEVHTEFIPEGATPFESKTNQQVTLSIDTEGVYVVQCKPHTMMAMIAVIVAGSATNLAAIKQQSTTLNAQFLMNKDRLNDILAKIE